LINKILIGLIGFLFILSCNHKVIEEIPNKTYIGVLVVVGNEPFSSFALDDGEGHITRLVNDKDFDNILNKLQGNKVEVSGTELPEGQSIKVRFVKIYNNRTE
jgi:hypothetical protein